MKLIGRKSLRFVGRVKCELARRKIPVRKWRQCWAGLRGGDSCCAQSVVVDVCGCTMSRETTHLKGGNAEAVAPCTGLNLMLLVGVPLLRCSGTPREAALNPYRLYRKMGTGILTPAAAGEAPGHPGPRMRAPASRQWPVDLFFFPTSSRLHRVEERFNSLPYFLWPYTDLTHRHRATFLGSVPIYRAPLMPTYTFVPNCTPIPRYSILGRK